VRIPLARYAFREVLLIGGTALMATVLAAILVWYVAPVFALELAFVVWFFRDPSRRTPEGPGLLVAPADGKVVEVAEVEEPQFLRTRTHKIAIFMSPLNVHVNRVPCDGTVEAVVHQPGRHRHAGTGAASAGNEAVAMTLVAGGTKVLVRQVAGALARRIVCAAAVGERLTRGARYGMIKFGSRVEVYVPVDSGFEVAVEPGQSVRGAETILGRFR
jgi:phosphatidylserine decarboxylase